MRSGTMIRVYFRDHHHEQSYLSFGTEEEALACVRRVRDRLVKVTTNDERGEEVEDEALRERLVRAAEAG